MADYWVVHPYDLIPVIEGMDMACLGETFNPFIAVVFRSGIKLGDTVCVTGANFIGQIVAQGMKKSGALEVTVIDNCDFRLNLATELVRPLGTLIFQGDFLHPVTLNNIRRWHHQSLDIRSLGWRHYTYELIRMWSPDCFKVMHHGLVQVKPLLTSTFPLEKVAEAFRAADGDPDQLKVVLKP